MNLIYNGEDIQVDAHLSLQQIITSKGAKPPFAVALNGQFVPAGRLPETKPENGDSVEVLSPIQGG
ncbi:thiamine biosynthesis protein ThiS [Pseudoalteromonas luteoviolacea]|uniref:Thiamine biosynthesis protein ThiS n=1 Tax=Pseudoalteromonas luteoviolacea TaxID=43657 RepID=A0A1C0TLL6_9GAMM|nr:sulfur carrier protein ThiS [Pseudoalteromonas luteoviolacea]MBQ4813463.1 sulfur carrier protein ThiS [Pseudoalteromonas luteoviolacea]OCQ19674.1 thiamine biosynthesis protein ThiS [Pseudoalteromonas luteoviolacea]